MARGVEVIDPNDYVTPDIYNVKYIDVPDEWPYFTNLWFVKNLETYRCIIDCNIITQAWLEETKVRITHYEAVKGYTQPIITKQLLYTPRKMNKKTVIHCIKVPKGDYISFEFNKDSITKLFKEQHENPLFRMCPRF